MKYKFLGKPDKIFPFLKTGKVYELKIEEKSDEELAEETEKTSITLTPVEDLIFHLLCKFQKRHEYLEAVQNDYESGCFGNGSAEKLINEIVNREVKELENAY